MLKQKKKSASKAALAKKKSSSQSQSQTPPSSQEETNRLLSGEVDEDIDVNTQSDALKKKKSPNKKATESKSADAMEEEDFEMGIESPKKNVVPSKKKSKTSSTATATVTGKKRKASAISGTAKVSGSKKPKVYELPDGEKVTRAQIETYDAMSTDRNIIPRTAIVRLVKEIIREQHPNFRITQTAMEMIQTLVEHEMTDMFFISNFLAMIRQKSTTTLGDVSLAALIKKMRNRNEGLGMHTSYDLEKILRNYKSKFIVKQDVPIENIAELGVAILDQEKNRGPKKKSLKTMEEEAAYKPSLERAAIKKAAIKKAATKKKATKKSKKEKEPATEEKEAEEEIATTPSKKGKEPASEKVTEEVEEEETASQSAKKGKGKEPATATEPEEAEEEPVPKKSKASAVKKATQKAPLKKTKKATKKAKASTSKVALSDDEGHMSYGEDEL